MELKLEVLSNYNTCACAHAVLAIRLGRTHAAQDESEAAGKDQPKSSNGHEAAEGTRKEKATEWIKNDVGRLNLKAGAPESSIDRRLQ